MPRFLAVSAVLCLALQSMGCTAVVDVDSFETDRGCDLRMSLTDFAAHFSAPDRMEFYVVAPSTSAAQANALASVLIIEEAPAEDFDILVPNAAPSRAHELQFFADTNGNGLVEPVVDGMRQDHTWTLPSACEDGPIPFVHVLNFQDFTKPSSIGRDLHVRVDGVPISNQSVELRVIVYEVPDPSTPTVSFERTVGGFHGLARGSGQLGIVEPFTIIIGGIIDSGVDYTLELWADGDGDDAFDRESGTDRFFRIAVPGANLDDPLAPFDFDTRRPDIATQTEHSGVVMIQPR